MARRRSVARLARAVLFHGDRGLESTSLQRGVSNEPGHCSAGLSSSASRTRCGMRQPSPRTVTGCSKAISPRSFSLRFCRRRKSKPCCRVSTSRSTGPCSKPGRASKASGRRTVRASLPARDAILVSSRRSSRAGTFQLTQKVALRRPNSWIRSARCR
jgi:hypothetical protein